MTAEIRLWGRTIGATTWQTERGVATFQYAHGFAASGIDVSPITAPLGDRIYAFPELPSRSFHGLPGLLADSLPDTFGRALIDAWLATEGRARDSFNPVERLCYVGSRGMGALEFLPALGPKPGPATRVSVDALVRLASDVLSNRQNLATRFKTPARKKALADILKVGTSAGGARAKAVVAWNRETNEVRTGQADADEGFEHWLLKFDGVAGNKDKELDDPKGFGAIEYAYSRMAPDAGIEMAECRLLDEHGRRHFMARRFDRPSGRQKLHMQSLAALAHFDFNQAGAYSYEQAFLVIRQLGLGASTADQMFRRMLFNIVARNQDDHVKNIAFLMDKSGQWSLAPAFDVTYSYNPSGAWTATHQMTVNGKRDGFTMADVRAAGKAAGLKPRQIASAADDVRAAVKRWPACAADAGVPAKVAGQIARAHRLSIPSR